MLEEKLLKDVERLSSVRHCLNYVIDSYNFYKFKDDNLNVDKIIKDVSINIKKKYNVFYKKYGDLQTNSFERKKLKGDLEGSIIKYIEKYVERYIIKPKEEHLYKKGLHYAPSSKGQVIDAEELRIKNGQW